MHKQWSRWDLELGRKLAKSEFSRKKPSKNRLTVLFYD